MVDEVCGAKQYIPPSPTTEIMKYARVFAGRRCIFVRPEGIPLWGNPRKCWCYRDEAFIKCMKHLAARCKHPQTLEAVCLAKSRLLASILAEEAL